ncbi:hypothetical protein [Methanosarcina barkeri]|uniref:hypothetical protein n=1 Tax=Methanosarcina barkeri TaxID=2208 RepID=UPI001FB2A608|nr:hypothetical protein [Methanosarcina barkeri]
MLDLIEFLALGSFLGLAAGTSPGPLLAVTISETLQYGKWEGIKVAVSPLITDLPIVLSVLYVLSHLKSYDFIIGIIAFFWGFISHIFRNRITENQKRQS